MQENPAGVVIGQAGPGGRAREEVAASPEEAAFDHLDEGVAPDLRIEAQVWFREDCPHRPEQQITAGSISVCVPYDRCQQVRLRWIARRALGVDFGDRSR